MDYPQNFDTPAFPGMRRMAVARTMCVWTSIAFMAASALCVILIWSAHSLRMKPFLISINNDTGEWGVISEGGAGTRIYTGAHAIQESVIGNFARRWFAISDVESENTARWCKCQMEDCMRNSLGENRPPCLVCCSSGSDLFNTFAADVLPDYAARAASGETWELDTDSIHVRPLSEISASGGLWHLSAVLVSSRSGRQGIEAYVRVARAADYYPLSMGFHVADFNAYRTEAETAEHR